MTLVSKLPKETGQGSRVLSACVSKNMHMFTVESFKDICGESYINLPEITGFRKVMSSLGEQIPWSLQLQMGCMYTRRQWAWKRKGNTGWTSFSKCCISLVLKEKGKESWCFGQKSLIRRKSENKEEERWLKKYNEWKGAVGERRD